MIPKRRIQKIRAEQQKLNDLIKNQRERISDMLDRSNYTPTNDQEMRMVAIQEQLSDMAEESRMATNNTNMIIEMEGGEERRQYISRTTRTTATNAHSSTYAPWKVSAHATAIEKNTHPIARVTITLWKEVTNEKILQRQDHYDCWHMEQKCEQRTQKNSEGSE